MNELKVNKKLEEIKNIFKIRDDQQVAFFYALQNLSFQIKRLSDKLSG